jgi:RecA-family ATPase
VQPLDLVRDPMFELPRRPDAPASIALWRLPHPITEAEFATAQLTPTCIVENYLFADVAVVIAPGGTGKTTLTLYEAVCIALGQPVFGLPVRKPGPVLIVTAEDSREMLVARMRAIADAMQLTPAQRDVVRRDVRISDVSGQGVKLTLVADDVVVPSPTVDDIIEQARPLAPVLISIDPAVSFGVGEARTNDAEQGLVEAARRIRAELGCCVRYVHHSGKQNARDKATDQYAGRGGSAMPDGARMVAVLHPLTSEEWTKAAGSSLLAGETGIVLARPKLSYAPPQPDILICRKGYGFQAFNVTTRTKAEALEATCEQVLRALEHDLARERHHTQNSLQALDLGRTRAEIRDAVSTLLAQGRIEHENVPGKPSRGARKYLRPVAAPDRVSTFGAAV